MAEKRIDPTDGQAYTYAELASFYKGKYKKQSIDQYWAKDCIVAKSNRKATAKAKTKAKARAAPATAVEKPPSKAKAKAHARDPAVEPSQIASIVDQLHSLRCSSTQPRHEVEACCAAVGERLQQLPEAAFLEDHKTVFETLQKLLVLSRPMRYRAPIEKAWKKMVAMGLRSSNLVPRRAAADELSDAPRRGMDHENIASWLQREGLLQELFGDRLDSRVLDEISLESLCEHSAAGVAALLAELEPGLRHSRGADVIIKKLHAFAVGGMPDLGQAAWGRDVTVLAIMKWARRLLAEKMEQAPKLVVGLVSSLATLHIRVSTSQGTTLSDRKVRMFSPHIGLGVEAAEETLQAVIDAMFALGGKGMEELMSRLEMAFEEAMVYRHCAELKSRLLGRLVEEIAAATPPSPTAAGNRINAARASGAAGATPLPATTFRVLLRLIQSYPFSVKPAETGRAGFSQGEALTPYSGLCSLLFDELKYFASSGPSPLDTEGISWRLRALCFSHRCLPGGGVDATRIGAIADTLKSIENGIHLCYFFRLLFASAGGVSLKANITNRPQARSAVGEGALAKALQILEDRAAEAGGLSMPAFFCLQQAVVMLGCKSGHLSLNSADGGFLTPEAFAVSGVVATSDANQRRPGPSAEMLGQWLLVPQMDGNARCGRVARIEDSMADVFEIDFIDEARGRTRVSAARVELIPELLEQEPATVDLETFGDPTGLDGLTGLWHCALGSGSNAIVQQKASELLLAIHQGDTGMQVFLKRLFEEIRADAAPDVLERGLALLDILVKRLPLTRKRAHLSCGFPVKLSVTEVYYEEVKSNDAVYNYALGKWKEKEVKMVRRTKEKTVQTISQSTVNDLHTLVSSTFGHRHMKLHVKPEMTFLDPCSQETLQEAGIASPGMVLEAEAAELEAGMLEENAVDRLGDGEWPERLLQLLGKPNCLSKSGRELCWELVRRMPTHVALLSQVHATAETDWPALFSKERPWHSVYAVLIIDAITSPLRERTPCDVGFKRNVTGATAIARASSRGEPRPPVRMSSAGEPKEEEISPTALAESWINDFVKANAVDALLDFFIDLTKACDRGDITTDDDSLRLSAALPPLVRAIATCALGQGCDYELKPSCGAELLRATIRATRWLFAASEEMHSNSAASWQQLRLRYASADGLDLSVGIQRISEVSLETIDELVLPLLLDLAKQVHGNISARVVGAILETSRRPGVLPILTKKLIVVMPDVAAQATAESGVQLFKVISSVLSMLSEKMSAMDPEHGQKLLCSVAEAALASRCHNASLYELLATILGGSGPLMSADNAGLPRFGSGFGSLALRLADRLLECILPELDENIEADAVREQAGTALLRLLESSDADTSFTVTMKSVVYLAQTPTPEPWDFQPERPEAPGTSEEARRNETGHVGLLNRGMTCYMNSTMQQLFWSLPFRQLILSAPPFVAEAERPEPLGAAEAKAVPITFKDVGLQVQRTFAYLQDCQLGQFNTDLLVNACKCLNLEYAVTSQNDASELLDKVLDAVDKSCSLPGQESQPPSTVFTSKTVRLKNCLHCGTRTRGREELMVRVQMNELKPTLDECLAKLTEPEEMKGDNKVICDHCNAKRDTKYDTVFTQLPQILVLHLARIQLDYETFERVKKNPRIMFDTKLNMSKYTEDAVVHGQENVPGCNYELQGVLVHTGTADSGHYYSYAQDSFGKWFKFNDDKVSNFSLDDLDNECYGGYESGGLHGKREKSNNAIMLFYRCVDAAPYRAGRGDRPATPLINFAANAEVGMQRSISDRAAPKAGPVEPGSPPSLQRMVTQALAGESLEERHKRRKQVIIRTSLREEIDRVNARLHRQAVVFSQASENFLAQLVEGLMRLVSKKGGETDPAATPSSGSAATQAVTLCRLAAKVLFDVALHSKRCSTEDLAVRMRALAEQVNTAPAARWLIARFTGDPDNVIGRSHSWVPTLVCHGLPHGDRFLAVIDLLPAAITVLEADDDDQSIEAVEDVINHLIDFMSSVTGETPIARYGETWARLVDASPGVRNRIAKYKTCGSSSIASLFLHFYLGGAESPLQAPPAPMLSKATFKGRRKAYLPLLQAVDTLWAEDPQLAREPIAKSMLFWETVAGRNPEVFIEDCAARRTLPDDPGAQRQVALVIVDSLRPSGKEDTSHSMTLRAALAYLITAGGEEQTVLRLAQLCDLCEKLMTKAIVQASKGYTGGGAQGGGGVQHGPYIYGLGRTTLAPDVEGTSAAGGLRSKKGVPFSESTDAGWDRWGDFDVGVGARGRGGKAEPGPKNPDAVQLIRVLQAVGSLGRELPNEWSWARTWLDELCSERAKWEGQGVPVDEARDLVAALLGAGESQWQEQDAGQEYIPVFNAGSWYVEGEYAFAFETRDGCAYYEHRTDPSCVLRQQMNAWGYAGWIIQQQPENGANTTMYETWYQYDDENATNALPPVSCADWFAVRGFEPCPLRT